MATSAPHPPGGVPNPPNGTAHAPGSVVECDVRGMKPDAVTVGTLARLQVVARRHGYTLRLLNASAELLEVVEFMGLGRVLTGP